MTEDPSDAAEDRSDTAARVEALLRENALLERRVARLERRLASTGPLVDRARRLTLWDFTPYEVSPDDTWVAVDRAEAAALMAALAEVDHWEPWATTIEPRPQP